LKSVASEGKGIPELVAAILATKTATPSLANRSRPERLREEAKALLRREWEKQIAGSLNQVNAPGDLKKLFSR
jgi:putative protein kinase ArgK-like GTPase of G3E family